MDLKMINNLLKKEHGDISLEQNIGMLYSVLRHGNIMSIKEIKDLIPKSLDVSNIGDQKYILNEAALIHNLLKKIVKNDTDKKILSNFVLNVIKAEKNLKNMEKLDKSVENSYSRE